MKLATWNINSIRARTERLFAWLDRERPDVLCLQETKVEDAGFPIEALRKAGYEVATFGQRSYNGVAIASTQPLADVDARLRRRRRDDDDARMIAATTHGIRVVCVYVPNGQDLDVRSLPVQARVAAPAARVPRAHRDARRSRSSLCGDMNVTPDDRDVWSPEKWKDQIHCSAAGARGARRGGRLRPRRSVPHAPRRREALLVVGLPRRRVLQGPGPADRSTSSRPGRSRSAARRARSIATRARARTRATTRR